MSLTGYRILFYRISGRIPDTRSYDNPVGNSAKKSGDKTLIKLIINDTYMLKFSAIYIYLSFLSIFSDDFFLGKKALSGRIPEIRLKKNTNYPAGSGWPNITIRSNPSLFKGTQYTQVFLYNLFLQFRKRKLRR